MRWKREELSKYQISRTNYSGSFQKSNLLLILIGRDSLFSSEGRREEEEGSFGRFSPSCGLFLSLCDGEEKEGSAWAWSFFDREKRWWFSNVSLSVAARNKGRFGGSLEFMEAKWRGSCGRFSSGCAA
ncbi:hypothetical protein HAX54_040321 [Datura stramonium]|uniref:Uncharacterized protein n=1 Tax=Datura stramonium TaxID=4076 RepID=A0ABS8SK88_DATST|nr:hypothetical protein [Datura stramonium]